MTTMFSVIVPCGDCCDWWCWIWIRIREALPFVGIVALALMGVTAWLDVKAIRSTKRRA